VGGAAPRVGSGATLNHAPSVDEFARVLALAEHHAAPRASWPATTGERHIGPAIPTAEPGDVIDDWTSADRAHPQADAFVDHVPVG
jgi:hypothetical protein